MTVFEQIVGLLNEKSLDFQVLEHEHVHTSSEAAKVRGTKPEQGAKALVMLADGSPLMLVLPGNLKVDVKLFKTKFKIDNLQMASFDQVEQLTGVKVGAVPPFGNLFNLKLFVDSKLLLNEQIAFNAGDHCKSVIMKSADFVSVCSPIVDDFSANS